MELTSERGKYDVPTLEGFPVDGSGTIFLVFLLGDPHLLKGVQGGEDRASGVERIQRNTERHEWVFVEPASPPGGQTRSGFALKGWGGEGNQCRYFLFCSYPPEELLTQSMWNTVSPEVQISATGGRKRTLRLPSSLSHPMLVFIANSHHPRQQMHFT